MAGAALSLNDVALIRRSVVAQITEPEPVAGHSSQSGARLDLLRAGGQVLAIQTVNRELSARLFGARAGHLQGDEPDLVKAIGNFVRGGAGAVWIAFRNFAPGTAHTLFQTLRSHLEHPNTNRLLSRLGTGKLTRMPATVHWPERESRPRFLITHSPRNEAQPLNFGFQFVEKVRALGVSQSIGREY